MAPKRKRAPRGGTYPKSVPSTATQPDGPDPSLGSDLLFESPLVAESRADPMGLVQTANAAFLRIWGYEKVEDVIGRPVIHFIKDHERASHIFGWLERVGSWQGCFEATTNKRGTIRVKARMKVERDGRGHRTGFLAKFVEDPGCDEAETNLGHGDKD